MFPGFLYLHQQQGREESMIFPFSGFCLQYSVQVLPSVCHPLWVLEPNALFFISQSFYYYVWSWLSENSSVDQADLKLRRMHLPLSPCAGSKDMHHTGSSKCS